MGQLVQLVNTHNGMHPGKCHSKQASVTLSPGASHMQHAAPFRGSQLPSERAGCLPTAITCTLLCMYCRYCRLLRSSTLTGASRSALLISLHCALRCRRQDAQLELQPTRTCGLHGAWNARCITSGRQPAWVGWAQDRFEAGQGQGHPESRVGN